LLYGLLYGVDVQVLGKLGQASARSVRTTDVGLFGGSGQPRLLFDQLAVVGAPDPVL
jgi:hypothetical protein